MGELFEAAVTDVYFLVPDTIDDPRRVSGGNRYDQRVRDGLRAEGWRVHMMLVTGRGAGWTARALAALPEGALALVDGLLVAREPEALVAHRSRLRVVVLAHMVAAPTATGDGMLGDRDLAALRSARRIVATSAWTRSELLEQDAADPHRIVVAHPGVDPAPATTPSEDGGRLLCVAAVAPHKGQDLLLRALAGFADRDGWTCTLVGSLDVDPGFVEALTSVIDAAGLTGRIRFAGVLDPDALSAAYGEADLVVLPSRSESYGMAVAEALAHGVPVLATGVGGIPEAIARPDAAMIVPPDDPWALHVVLQQWWASATRRDALKAAALEAREAGRSWEDATAVVASALRTAAMEGLRAEAVPS
ncbi:glycosyltransferase family 4 protein [Leifsonia shinshuensis]|uniref:D-inositol 3-phosphate glycosyltransferase n=1 Tax=Leifsonia shinshuensis TaxID=150026 RepID=A0A7G6YBA0_9MICO|nr:glycosyltransferase family 4 protein [Leifsonia shinshuensis]QNE35765.1 glycosyltransferase family 4 protein [Leifsonia shinshuensis]